ncbi:TraB/GumN family protein [Pontibacter burrus]|uniref:TraB/GumN family protein n=1 Tax=Pontibacter burrus TaxID=2704466 RepID=A0A6B3LQP0_9BACT|nr:TraB/GumN family protein [Pontibacter burrus]NEM98163.1 TraB/GumN family protein [Pontibacter burrus]
MNNKNKIACLFLIVIAFLFNPVIGEAQKVKSRQSKTKTAEKNVAAKSLLWEVSGNGLKQPSYLYGTYHLLNDSYLNTVPEVKARFEQSKGVVVEVELDSAKMMQMGAKMVMPDNKISSLLSAEDFALVGQEVKQTLGYDLRMLDQMKPVTLMLMLSMTEYQKQEVVKQYTGQALDAYFANTGRKNGKKITSLETLEQQFNILYDHYPIDKQATQLVEYVKNKEKVIEASKNLSALYLEKDLAGMWDVSVEYNKLTGGEDMAYIVDDRNKNWMTQLPAIMKEQSMFIAVGAMHLPGQNGLIELLRSAGYTVKPLQ